MWPHINDILKLVFDYFLVIAGFDIDLSNGQQFINGYVWIRPCLVFCMHWVYDIMYDVNVCSCMMSYPLQVLWYHDMNAIISYTKSYCFQCTWSIYDIMAKGMISYMITDMISSFHFIWYWVYLWYHIYSYEIIYNIMYMILCMILQYDISWQISWYCKWYHIQNHMILCVLKNSIIS